MSAAAPSSGFSDPDLWLRVRTAPLPVTRDGLDFAATLAAVRDIPLRDAHDLVTEYRRFLYLAALDQTMSVPPASVEMAWDLHRQSPDYARFCTETLGASAVPGDGARNLGSSAAYRATRAAYRREFGEAPPSLIWPGRITPRLPRWLVLHGLILGASVVVAWLTALPAALAFGVGLSLALYGFDLWMSAHKRRRRLDIGAAVTGDLTHFLSAMDRS